MSSSEGTGSDAGSDFEPGAESEVSPVKPPVEKNTSKKRGRNSNNGAPNGPMTSTAQSGTSKASAPNSSNAGASTSQFPNPYLMPALGAGGIPIVLPGQAPMTNNERAHLYTFLRQLPLGFARVSFYSI